MTEALDSTTNIDSKLMKRVSRMREAGLSIKETALQLGVDENTVKKVLRPLGYALTD